MATDLYQGWDHRWLGTATIDWTDDTGAHSVDVTSASTGTSGTAGLFSHLAMVSVDPKDRRGSTLNLGFAAFAAYLQALMDAGTTETITVAFDASTLAYTIAAPTSAVFTLTFTGSAGATMRRILGFTGNKTGALTYTSDMRPFYVFRAAIDAKTAFDQPAMIDGQIRSRTAADGALYTLAPTRPAREARWEHRFQSNASVHRRAAAVDTTVSGTPWTFEDFAEHAGQYGVPCIVKDATESMVFQCGRGFARDAYARARPDLDAHQTIRLMAGTVRGYL